MEMCGKMYDTYYYNRQNCQPQCKCEDPYEVAMWISGIYQYNNDFTLTMTLILESMGLTQARPKQFHPIIVPIWPTGVKLSSKQCPSKSKCGCVTAMYVTSRCHRLMK